MNYSELMTVLRTLNRIEVHGKDNLDMLLGCILTLEAALKEEQEEDHA